MDRQQNIARVVGKESSTGYIIVRLDHRVSVEFGEMWIIDEQDQLTSTRYFARVVDAKYGVNEDSITDYAKTLLDHSEMSLDEMDRELIGFNFALVNLLGVINSAENRIIDYYRIPTILSEVRRPNDSEYALVVIS